MIEPTNDKYMEKDNKKKDKDCTLSASMEQMPVMMYGCLPPGETTPGDVFPIPTITTVTTTPPDNWAGRELDKERVNAIVKQISDYSRELGKIEGLDMSDACKLDVMHFDKQGSIILHVPASDDIAEGIVELIRSHYETEIERLEAELRKILGD
jgi:hypothetical protein